MERPANLVYWNEWYHILPNPNGIGYHIINNKTEVVEGVTEVLPSAVSKSNVWNELMQELVAKEAQNESTD